MPATFLCVQSCSWPTPETDYIVLDQFVVLRHELRAHMIVCRCCRVGLTATTNRRLSDLSRTTSTRVSNCSGGSQFPFQVRAHADDSACIDEAHVICDAVATTLLFGGGYLLEMFHRLRRNLIRLWHKLASSAHFVAAAVS